MFAAVYKIVYAMKSSNSFLKKPEYVMNTVNTYTLCKVTLTP